MNVAAVTVQRARDPESVDRILTSLPDWFGIDEANRAFVAEAAVLDSYLARRGDDVVGVALVDRPFAASAGLHLIAVAPEHHRTGVGAALIEAIERELIADGVRLLEVQTLGPSYPDPFYARTRDFYLALGFLEVRELTQSGWDQPTLIMVKRLPEA